MNAFSQKMRASYRQRSNISALPAPMPGGHMPSDEKSNIYDQSSILAYIAVSLMKCKRFTEIHVQ
jgi:hypothetical protein